MPAAASGKGVGWLKSRVKESLLEVNRFLLFGSLALILLSAGLYVWANYYAEAGVSTAGVKKLSFQDSDLGQFVKMAKLSGDTLYIVTQPTFESLRRTKRATSSSDFTTTGTNAVGTKVVYDEH